MMDPCEENKPLLVSPVVQQINPQGRKKHLLLVFGLVVVGVTLTTALLIPLVSHVRSSSPKIDATLQAQDNAISLDEQVKEIFYSVFQSEVIPEYHLPPEYIVNLDLPPEQRWTEVARDYRYQLPRLADEILELVIPKIFIPLIQKVAGVLENSLKEEYAKEIKGMADAAGMEVGALLIGNIIYDVTAHCTSIVAEDSNGQIWHARNLDYDFTNTLKDMTIQVNFQRGGKTLYKATTFPGYAGILTGQKPNKFTISADQRDPGTSVWENLLVALVDRKAHLMSFAIREALEKSGSFAETVEMLTTVDTLAPVYYIIGGVNPGEGAVITKGRLEAVDVWFLNVEQERWFLVETNYDHWEPPPYSDNRRDPANHAMNSTGQAGISTKTFFNILHLPNVRDVTTVYTTVMSAVDPSIYTTRVLPKIKLDKDTFNYTQNIAFNINPNCNLIFSLIFLLKLTFYIIF